MAEQSLFGTTPEALMASRDAALRQQAAQYAQLDPFQQATMGIYQGANKLGGAVGGMLGGQDPEMMRIKQRQSMLQGLDLSNPESLKKGIQTAMQNNDYQAASELNSRYQALQATAIKQGLDTSNMAANLATAAGKQFDISPEGRGQELAKTGKFTSESIAKFIIGGGQLEAIDKFTKPAADFIAKAVELGFGEKPAYGGYTAEQTGKINQSLLLDETTKRKAGSVKIVNELTQAPDIVTAVSAFDKSVAPYVETRDSARTAQSLINDAVKSNNSQAFEAARTTLAKTIGQNKLSNEDIARTGIDPRLVAGALDWVNKKIVGVPNADVLKQMYAVSRALEMNATTRIDKQAERTQAAAIAQGFKGDKQLFFPMSTPPTQGGDAAKEARYQAWKQTQQGKN